MQFSLNEELEMTRSFVREFAESEVAPLAGERDEREQFDRKLFDQMGKLGITGIPISERYGGAGSDWLTFSIVVEELARVCASTAAALAAHTVFTAWPLYVYGDDSIKAAYLGELAMGTMLGTSALPMPNNMESKISSRIAAQSGNENWLLNGAHSCVMQAGIADCYLVFAQIEPNRRRNDMNAYLIESGAPGLHMEEKIQRMGLRSFPSAKIRLEQCPVPKKNQLGVNRQGHAMALSLADIAHISAAAQAVGIAQGAYEAAAAYAKERKQFGLLIGKQQGISFKLADLWTRLEAARLLTYQAAWRKDAGLECGREAAIARKFSAECAVAAAIEAIQVFGGYGYMQEYRMERFLRDAKCLESELGTGGMDFDCLSHLLDK
ncbi:acyl-CoA dehydrogenase family protein [Paenibacillus sp. LHD-38]|uniref:acyl-CoA dehydrogenase family protein n=1 Tax=Paenibacillus sp. LHD-38 TaxID=3072143 RepID=UPI00280EE28E|nr:acyl-CoA dehydrogenase family protein [Paenibacillus sp. LHD-38]MDQ8733599.1 acyl-CoA dehydrogenase family protein [Paenibacillus sp. LHD-38]